MKILDKGVAARKAECEIHLEVIFRSVLTVTAAALAADDDRFAQRVSGILLKVLNNAVLVGIRLFDSGAVVIFIGQGKGNAAVDGGLPAQCSVKIVKADVDIGKNLEVGAPFDARSGSLVRRRLLEHLADRAAGLELQKIAEAVAEDFSLHIFGRILRCAQAKPIEADRVFIAPALVLVLAAGIQLAEHQLPVIALFLGVVVNRDAAPEILHLDGFILKIGNIDAVAVTEARLINRVRYDLKHGMLAGNDIVRPEHNAGAQSDTLLIFQPFDAFVCIVISHGSPHGLVFIFLF